MTNTVGKLCEEKKAELGIIDEEYAKGRRNRKKETIKSLGENLQAYRNWLLNITICDPACGSGAFLNQALEFLMEEHAYVDELQAQLFGASIVFQDVSNHILEKNIFGVDINDESVDIAKLSLWLRTAQRGRKLTTLNNNIKCGNSLIDDPSVAGEKAFNWQKEFPSIFVEKEKKAFHITTATHDSRTSQRMVDYKVRALRDNGLNPKAQPIWLEAEDEILITNTIYEIIKEDELNVMAYNICGDHLHLLLVCEEEEVSKIVGKIKGKTSRVYHSNKGINPLVQKGEEKSVPLWTQKFGCNEIKDEKQLWNTVEYIRTNREKHELPPLHSSNKGINPLVPIEKNELFYCSYQHAFRAEYKGGFDAVIGNPPYVKLEQIKDVSESLSKMKYKTFDKRGDLYVLFVERGFEILKKNGLISYIMPNKWLQAGYGEKLRGYFLTKQLDQLIDFGDIQIFEGATTYPVIFIARQNKANETFKAALLKNSNALDFDFNVESSSETFTTNQFSKDTWVISSGENQQLLSKLSSKHKTLKEFISGGANYGIKPGFTEAFIIDEKTKNKIITENANAEELIKPMLRGRDIQPWYADYQNYYFVCTFPAFKINIDNYPSIKNHLLSFGKERLEQSGNKGSRKKTSNKWFETQDTIAYYNDFAKPKIMYQKFQVKPCFIYDESGLYCNDSMWIIPTDNKALLGILNSKMGWWLITKYCTQIQNGCQLIWNYFGQIPVPEITSSVELTVLVETMITKTAEQQKLANSFISLLQSKFEIEKLTTKLQNWHELEFGDFLKELKKAKVQLSLSEEAEWMQYFNEQKQKAQALKSEIDKIDKEIDKMVYELYGLSEEEINIVEGN